MNVISEEEIKLLLSIFSNYIDEDDDGHSPYDAILSIHLALITVCKCIHAHTHKHTHTHAHTHSEERKRLKQKKTYTFRREMMNL